MITKVFQSAVQADVPSRHHKRIYPKALLEREFKRFSEEKVFGRFGPESTGPFKLSDISHMVRRAIVLEDGNVSVEIDILDTPKGKELMRLIQLSPARWKAFPSGLGSLERPDWDGTCRVRDDYHLDTFNIVMDEP